MPTSDALSPRLEALQKAVQALSEEDRQSLLKNPGTFFEIFGTRTMEVSSHHDALKTYATREEPFEPHPFQSPVRFTSEQLTQRQKLQKERFDKLPAEVAALLRLRGERIDPFPEPDPEPESDKEE